MQPTQSSGRPRAEPALGTQLRALLDAMDADVAQACADVGLTDYRPRFSPYIRVLLDRGPASIREMGHAVGVTHSAASQTIAQMARRDLVALTTGVDARSRIVHLTDTAQSLLPAIQAEWAATAAATAALDAELPYPLSDVAEAVHDALARRAFRERIGDAARTLDDDVLGPFRAALTDNS
jgi:DNA-binding MarR family transcriptional regulator